MSFREKLIVFFGAWLFLGGGLVQTRDKMPGAGEELGKFLPAEVEGWHPSGSDESYDPESIFQYIDGAGEVYRAYNFRSLLVRRFVKQGQPDIIVDFFDMGKPEDAFGVFTHDLEGEKLDIGQAATYQGGLLSFWKSRFFVSVYAEKETPEVRGVVLKLGQIIAAAIPEEGKKPDLLNLLPSGFSEDQVRYFHSHLILNYHFFVASANLLLLDQDTEAILAPFRREEGRSHLLLVRYPDGARAERAWRSFVRGYMPDAKEPGVVQTEDGTWTGIKTMKKYVFVVFHALSKEEATKILAEVEAKISFHST